MPNPVLQREYRARWRTWPAVVMLGGFVALFAVDVAFIMLWRRAETGLPPGRILLRDSMPFLFVMWLLLGPALTAPSLAGERERGLLAPVLMSKLTTWEIVWGKWLSAMSFAGLLLLVPLPVMALGFILGGVSPGEFGVLALLQTATLGAGAALGLAYSATSARPFNALAAALFTNAMLALIPFVSPLLAAFGLLWGKGTFDGGFSSWPCVLSSVLLLVLIPSLLWATASSLELRVRDEPPHSAVEPMEKIQQARRVSLEEAIQSGETGRWDLPLAALFKFKNPLLQREVESKLRLRTTISPADAELMETSRGDAGTVLIAILILGALLVFGPPELRAGLWKTLTYAWILGATLAAILLGALCWVRDRELGQLESLLVSLLRPRDLVLGKIGAILVVCAYYCAPIWLITAFCLRNEARDISLGFAFQTWVFGLCLVFAAASWGAWVSWRSLHTTRALVVALGAPLIVAFAARQLLWFWPPLWGWSLVLGALGMGFWWANCRAIAHGPNSD